MKPNNRLNNNINISEAFVHRARCKKCGMVPEFYFYYKISKPFSNITESKKFFDLFKNRKLVSYHYLCCDPVDFKSIRYFCSYYRDNKLSSLPHRKHIHDKSYDNVDYARCKCGGTLWFFNQQAAKSRKGKYKY